MICSCRKNNHGETCLTQSSPSEANWVKTSQNEWELRHKGILLAKVYKLILQHWDHWLVWSDIVSMNDSYPSSFAAMEAVDKMFQIERE